MENSDTINCFDAFYSEFWILDSDSLGYGHRPH